MSLRWRVAAVMLLASVVPVGVSGWVLLREVEKAERAALGARVEATAVAASARLRARQRRVGSALQRLCAEDLVVDELLLGLQAGRAQPALAAPLQRRVPGLARALGVDALVLLDGRAGPGFGSPFAVHPAGGALGVDLVDALLRPRGRRAPGHDDPRWLVGALPGDPGARGWWTGCVARQGQARVLAAAALALDAALLEELGAGDPAASLVYAPGPPPAEGEAVATLMAVGGGAGLTIVARAEERPLRARRLALRRTLAGCLAATVGVALLLGLVLAVGLARPLGELRRAADRVAEGAMDSTIRMRAAGEVGRTLSAFNRMTAELQRAQARLLRAERIAAWRDIARRIAHEIKNPLMPIQTSIETMRKTHARRHPDFDEIFEESTATILEEVERLKAIVTEFSRFARLPRPSPVSLDVREVAQHVVGLHAAGPVAVRLELADDAPAVRADPDQLVQVLVNLVQNGADAARARHGDAGGEVRVAVRSGPRGGVRLSVEDNGPGIPPDERGQVFEPYFTTKPHGTGLGLAIVHRIVSDHGGSVDVEEGPEGGARFEVTLPREGPPEEAGASVTL
ncbi:MAG: PAS domain-containing sensor histidine kinase [Sandaracinaceae bacterium]